MVGIDTNLTQTNTQRQKYISSCCVCTSKPLPTRAGLGGAVGYALGGLDWTHTFLGAAFKSQEQILFFFAAILFSASVVLHLFSIDEQSYLSQHDRLDQVQCVGFFNLKQNCSFFFFKYNNPKTLLFFPHQESPDRTKLQPSANGRTGLLGPKLELIGEDETMDRYDIYNQYGDNFSEHEDMDMDFLEMELVRSKFVDPGFFCCFTPNL